MSRATFGLGGHGLLIAPVCPCNATVTADNELVISHGQREVARFTPGAHAASADPTWASPSRGQFGEGGPTLVLADQVAIDDVTLLINAGIGESPWVALGPGIVHDLPPGVTLVGPGPDDDSAAIYELHLDGGHDELIRLTPQDEAAAAVRIQIAPYQEVLVRDTFNVQEGDGAVRAINYTEVAYEHEGIAWKQLMIVAPLRATTSMVVTAQARMENTDTLFKIAVQVAATMGPLG